MGQVYLKWSPDKKNKKIAHSITKLKKEIERMIGEEKENIFEITLNYSIAPTIFKGLLEGNEMNTQKVLKEAFERYHKRQ